MSKNLEFTPLEIGDSIGIIGGGQLAKLLSLAAMRLGLKVCLLDPAADCPASQVVAKHIVAAYDDIEALKQLGACCKVVTYEFENINAAAVRAALGDKTVFPPLQALDISSDRRKEKSFFAQNNLPTTEWLEIKTPEELCLAANKWSAGSILKTCTLGYDGRGQVALGELDLAQAQEILRQFEGAPLLLERRVKFSYEISIIAARSMNGEISLFDIAENQHENGILRTSTVPAAKLHLSQIAEVRHIATTLLQNLNYVGVLGLELFVLPDGQILLNEFAPRVHNSGHWTEVGCLISQFEKHIRAICAYDLGEAELVVAGCKMHNLIGRDIDKLPELIASGDKIITLYGKKTVSPNRKMGHYIEILRD